MSESELETMLANPVPIGMQRGAALKREVGEMVRVLTDRNQALNLEVLVAVRDALAEGCELLEAGRTTDGRLVIERSRAAIERFTGPAGGG